MYVTMQFVYQSEVMFRFFEGDFLSLQGTSNEEETKQGKNNFFHREYLFVLKGPRNTPKSIARYTLKNYRTIIQR